MDANNYGAQQGGWFNPAFATYGTPLAQKLTNWLYEDRVSNPTWQQPSEWAKVGRVAFLDRAVNIGPVAPSSTLAVTANLGGGKNIIIFSRQATVRDEDAPAAGAYPVLPNELASYVSLQIQRQSGFIDTEDAPINNNFGFGYKPFIRPVPELWLGNETRTFTVTNTSAVTVNVLLTFQIALLDTGR
jgi:hypothetical protein